MNCGGFHDHLAIGNSEEIVKVNSPSLSLGNWLRCSLCRRLCRRRRYKCRRGNRCSCHRLFRSLATIFTDAVVTRIGWHVPVSWWNIIRQNFTVSTWEKTFFLSNRKTLYIDNVQFYLLVRRKFIAIVHRIARLLWLSKGFTLGERGFYVFQAGRTESSWIKSLRN